MSSLIQFPFQRLQYAGKANPRYVSDVVAADQIALDAITAISGLGASDFAIFSGLEFIDTISGSNYYTAGVFYLNGTWYYQPSDFNENLYLAPNVTGIMPYIFSDAVSRNIYQVNYSQSSASPSGNTPQFTGDMNAYRMDIKTIFERLVITQTATTLVNIQTSSLPSSLVLTFPYDQAQFFAAAPVDCTITFDFTGAIPGTVIRLKWTYGSGRTLTVTGTGGQTILKDGGDITAVASNINVMYFLYAGKNSAGNDEVSYSISQPS